MYYYSDLCYIKPTAVLTIPITININLVIVSFNLGTKENDKNFTSTIIDACRISYNLWIIFQFPDIVAEYLGYDGDTEYNIMS